jgi:hypothetical protein
MVELLCCRKKVAHVVDAMHPVAALDDLPSQNSIAANERVGLIEHGPFEYAKVRRRLRRESKHFDNDLAEPVGDTSDPGIGNDSCDTGFSAAAGGAW